jgi:acetoin:2,6-dichlorophenolindophenol oxidoreductase subunit alpha
VFVCENNQYMEYTPISSVIPTARPAADKAVAYGLAPVVVDGNDIDAVRAAAARAVARARAGEGPSLLELDTYRLKGHSAADAGAYRPPEEVEAWRGRDPLLRHREALLARGVPADVVDAVRDDAHARVSAVAGRVLAAPAPDPATAWTDVWSDGGSRWRS